MGISTTSPVLLSVIEMVSGTWPTLRPLGVLAEHPAGSATTDGVDASIDGRFVADDVDEYVDQGALGG